MLTRRAVTHQYAALDPATQAPPPHHFILPPWQDPGRPADRPPMSRHSAGGGGLEGGAVALNTAGWVGIRRSGTGYGYLGMDPSDPQSWPRPFRPAAGMIAYLNGPASG